MALLNIFSNTFIDTPIETVHPLDSHPRWSLCGEEDDDNGSAAALAEALPDGRFVARSRRSYERGDRSPSSEKRWQFPQLSSLSAYETGFARRPFAQQYESVSLVAVETTLISAIAVATAARQAGEVTWPRKPSRGPH